MTKYSDLNVPLRTIMTPGPVEVDPRNIRSDGYSDFRAI